MVGVAQLVEPRIVIPVVAGSIPVTHPTLKNNAMCNSAFNPIKTWADIDEILVSHIENGQIVKRLLLSG